MPALPRPEGRTPYEGFPELAAQWHSTRNRLAPDQVGEISRRRVWWTSPCCGYEWEDSPRDRILQPALRCPVCKTILRSLAEYFLDLLRSDLGTRHRE